MTFLTDDVVPAQPLGTRIEDIDPVGEELTEGELRLVSGGRSSASKTLDFERGLCDVDCPF